MPSATEGCLKLPPSTTYGPDPNALLNAVEPATKDLDGATSPVSCPRNGQPSGYKTEPARA